MEFPAVGSRGTSNGTLYDAGRKGSYWSSVASDSFFVYSLYFAISDLAVTDSNGKPFGFSVRCVRQ
ncbi:MAG: fibrobacter succinogenes major paralogous domain-containing protein [Rikenellaceae bacterium]|nr:fibrobacter succinogenes major paralogous domain-containing protein [Rikenellaceae bacterium]